MELCDEDALYVPLSEACLSKLYPSISLKDSSWQDPLGAKRCVWNVRPVNACESPSRSWPHGVRVCFGPRLEEGPGAAGRLALCGEAST